MMRELDTVSPVVWPSWCYSGEGQNETDNSNTTISSATSGQTIEGSHHIPVHPLPTKPRAKRRNNPIINTKTKTMNGETKDCLKTTEEQMATIKKEISLSNSVKSERLSPTTTTNSTTHIDNNSNSSRSGTPSSSYPGTPPGVIDRGGGSPTHPQGHLKHMEQMMSRNYSDFMRSLAAKYNNSNPNDYFSASRNGFPSTLDPRFSSFKTGATPFVGLMAPLNTTVPPTTQPPSTTSSSPGDQSKHQKSPQSDLFHSSFGVSSLNGMNPFSTTTPNPLFPPMIDMSSTQALLNMVRTASAQNQVQLENYLKGANKRQTESSPLDLSSAAPPNKKSKKDLKDAFYGVDSLLNLPLLEALRTKELAKNTGKQRPGSVSPNNKKLGSPRHGVTPSNTKCASLCATDGQCSAEAQIVANWTVDEVCSFVGSIDICAEYEKNFRDERIDGASLPLLTEEHLTNVLSMKLGPALKLRATLARKLGHCAVCLHCVHCHGASSINPAVTITPTHPASGNRPNSTGN